MQSGFSLSQEICYQASTELIHCKVSRLKKGTKQIQHK